MESDWHLIKNAEKIDTPFLAVYPDRINENIALALHWLEADLTRFRPHIKTHKMGEVIQLLRRQGITKIKCATIAEAELAAEHGMPDILLAYQPVGTKITRFINLMGKYPDTLFSCLVDNLATAANMASAAQAHQLDIPVYIDLNTGMNRTGYPFLESLPECYETIHAMRGLHLLGLHIYDGHLHHEDPVLRTGPAKAALIHILQAVETITASGIPKPVIIAGGSNTFSFYANTPEVECSPGTFVFWDVNYMRHLPELQFKPAALLVCTVISIPTSDTVCVDLGYKSVSSENPIDKRIVFPWNPDLSASTHSEEHLVVKHTGKTNYAVGDILYGIPYHICPSCALYDEAVVVSNHQAIGQWTVLARRKKITI